MSSATRRTSCTAIWRKSRGPVTHDRLAFCFGIHNHQPIGNFDHVLVERVWDPHLPRVLAEAGVEYVLVDDSHFALAGLDPDTLGGYYLTEDQGVRLRVFPISQRLRYLIPFAGVEASLEYLAARRGRVPAVTMVDDGEKFGVWPGTHAHVYEKGWLDRFFDRLLATEWLDLVTLSDIVDRVEATDRVYLPTASYREMGEWVRSEERR